MASSALKEEAFRLMYGGGPRHGKSHFADLYRYLYAPGKPLAGAAANWIVVDDIHNFVHGRSRHSPGS